MWAFSEKPGLSERNQHYLRLQIMWVYLKNGLYLRAHLFTKEHPRSQDCIRTSDDPYLRAKIKTVFR